MRGKEKTELVLSGKPPAEGVSSQAGHLAGSDYPSRWNLGGNDVTLEATAFQLLVGKARWTPPLLLALLARTCTDFSQRL